MGRAARVNSSSTTHGLRRVGGVVPVVCGGGRCSQGRTPPARPPPGHLQPFGAWSPGIPVEVRDDVPRPQEFFGRYCSADRGAGRPLVLRGAARRMPAMGWTDDRLLEKFADARISDVEVGLKETRTGGRAEGFSDLGTFLAAYNRSDIHLVSSIPPAMSREVELLPLLRCGGFLNFLGSSRLWISRGGSRSVVHKDDAENVNCLLAGSKRFAMVHPRWRAKLEEHPNAPSPPDRFGYVDARVDPSAPGYGAYFGRLDVDAMDLVRFPGWADVEWYRADLQAGDCLYIPRGWYHQVRAGPSRTVNAHVWYWRPLHFQPLDCAPGDISRRGIRFSDCSWGYVPPVDGPTGEPRGVDRRSDGTRMRLTRCTRGGRHRWRRPLRHEL
mmetsp:Transcript_97389/g.275347  ORF Transcript_97389/g.275347 Transcript_97389/m.275347 type:complete len:384 (+) Transcript_97389:56-1207(+)